jgi:hypothetical protein
MTMSYMSLPAAHSTDHLHRRAVTEKRGFLKGGDEKSWVQRSSSTRRVLGHLTVDERGLASCHLASSLGWPDVSAAIRDADVSRKTVETGCLSVVALTGRRNPRFSPEGPAPPLGRP